MARRRWSELSPWQRVAMGTGAALQIGLLIAAETDIQKRPAEQIRGPKAVWRCAVLVNFIGPLTYFRVGRR